MTRWHVASTSGSGSRNARIVLSLGLAVLLSPAGLLGQAEAQSLNFFKNYFITGGYEVGGVGLLGQGLNGVAAGDIVIAEDDPATPDVIEGVPAGAEIVAAFLYAQVVSAEGGDAAGAGVTFHGVPLSTPAGSFAVIGDPLGATPCWSGGGGTGQSGGSKRTYSLRYDVLRMLPLVDGRPHAGGPHPVTLPDVGNGSTPIALGASLVVIYRDPALPLNAIVIYDGSWAMDNSTHGMTQAIEGFYDPAPGVTGSLTHIVGSAQANKSENLKVNGFPVGPGNGVNLFTGLTASAEQAWDNVTVATPNPGALDVLTTSVDSVGIPNHDCLTWSAIIYRTEVNDPDEDGYLSAWETNAGELADPNGVPLPPLALMGANPNRKDLFVEIGYMRTFAATSNAGDDAADGLLYGGVLKPHHTHRPPDAVLEMVGDAFKTAPVSNPNNEPDGIDVHFDVGSADDYPQSAAKGYVILGDLARGGEEYDEMITVCGPEAGDPQWVCQFALYPGTVGWKSGFRGLRDALLQPAANVPLDEEAHPCDAPGNDGPGQDCERVFDRNRKDIFRYVLFAHHLGVPKAHCLDLTGEPDTNPHFGLADPDCQAGSLFHTPNSYTGVADFGGGDAMVSMGGFLNAAGEPVGTVNQQAGTLMHELGHTLMLTHGGAPGNPNCSPNYLSIMNYQFQLRSLIDELGDHRIDYSGQTIGALYENSLSETSGLSGLLNDPPGAPRYRTAWYAPYMGIGTKATRHCDGSAILDGAEMIRVDGTDVAGPVDWNGVGDADETVTQDVNFNGVINDGDGDPLLAGFNDWGNLRLNQVGSRRNIGVWFLADDFPYLGPASLDMGRFDFGRFDFGRFDFGRFDFGNMNGEGALGRFDFGRFDFGDLNLGDLGRFDFGRFDFGRFDFGRFDFGQINLGRFDFGRFDFGVGAGDLGRGVFGKGGIDPADFGRFDFGRFDFGSGGGDGELTIGLAVAAGLLGPPTNLTACAADDLGNPACSGPVDGADLRVLLTWDAPDASPSEYVVYRRDAGGAFASLATVNPADGVNGTFEFVDTTVDYDTTYEYYVAAKYVADGEVSESASNVAGVTTDPQLLVYGFVPIKNLPPKGPQKTGSSIPLEWRFTLDGVAVNSFDAQPAILITGPGGAFAFTAEDPGGSSFHPPTDNNTSWQFNWQAVYPTGHPQAGQNLPKGPYHVEIYSAKTEQTFNGGTTTLK